MMSNFLNELKLRFIVAWIKLLGYVRKVLDLGIGHGKKNCGNGCYTHQVNHHGFYSRLNFESLFVLVQPQNSSIGLSISNAFYPLIFLKSENQR
jgi:hypothetical protein